MKIRLKKLTPKNFYPQDSQPPHQEVENQHYASAAEKLYNAWKVFEINIEFYVIVEI